MLAEDIVVSILTEPGAFVFIFIWYDHDDINEFIWSYYYSFAILYGLIEFIRASFKCDTVASNSHLAFLYPVTILSSFPSFVNDSILAIIIFLMKKFFSSAYVS